MRYIYNSTIDFSSDKFKTKKKQVPFEIVKS